MPALPEPQEPLTDGVVSLRLYAERDIPEILIAYQDDPQLHLRLGEDRPPTGAQLGRQSEEAARKLAEGAGVSLTISESGSDVCRGQVNVQHINWEHARAEVGLWLAPQVRRRGLGAPALRLAAGWLLAACGLQRLQVLTEPDNEAMLATARAAGFRFEGVLRGYTLERGRRVDNAILSLLVEDVLG
jgi:RimJ/RimL family protein N-acetyltransferase